ncbi:MAG: glycoside hydrolase family 19 protein, partial [Vicinamibacterales bacterium]
MLNDEQLHAIMPALSVTKRVELLPFLQAAMAEFAIDQPAREAAFVAQLAHESGQFRFMEEIWGPTAAQRRYEPHSTLAATLGNTAPGDGKRFKGRGPIQITGRANYHRFGALLGIDLVSDPERAAVPDLAFRIAGLFWMKKGLNELADRTSAEAFREITKRINGGVNGQKDRERFYAAARAVLGVTEPPLPRGTGLGDRSPGAEAEFERGHEAIRAFARRRRARKTAPRSRTTAARRPGTARGSRQARRATTP